MSFVHEYGEGLYSLAVEENKLETFKNDLLFVDDSFNGVNDFKEFFNSVKISKAIKKDVVKDSLKTNVDKEILNFICLLIDNNRIGSYHEIIREYIHLANNDLHIREGIIETANKLPSDKIKEIEKKLCNDSYTVELTSKINPSLISGFRIIFEDEIIDYSTRSKFEKIKKSLERKKV